MKSNVAIVSIIAALILLTVACGSGSRSQASAPNVVAQVQPQSCGAGRALADGDTHQVITSRGVEREYLLHVPSVLRSGDGFAPATIPLLLVFHGAGTNAQFNADMTAIAASADRYGMAVAFPEANEMIWNVYGDNNPAGDLAFVADLAAHLTESLCIDPGRVYATGFSVGGGMTQLLACERPDLIAAVGIVAGPYLTCDAAVPLIAFHGDEDRVAPYQGRSGEGPLPPVQRAVQEWANRMQCDGPEISHVAFDVELATHHCLSGQADVRLYTVIGGGHTWPGSAIELPVDFAGATTRSISATELILEFFESQPR